MPNKIILSENGEKVLIYKIIEDTFFPSYEKIFLLKKFMDKNFILKNIDDIEIDGLPSQSKSIFIKDKNGNIINKINKENLFYMLQDKFKNIYSDKNKRDIFIKQFVDDWVDGKINDDCLLSKNNLTLD